ncbi:MAG: phosphoribosyltransferase, partial [Alphaproteobacteria bacterium]
MSSRFSGFANRTDAGGKLAERIREREFEAPVVLALPRGGVPVAFEIARGIGARLDLVLVRKIGVPYQPELALAAVVNGDDPEVVVNPEVSSVTGLDETFLDAEVTRKLKEIERRRADYLQGRAQLPVEGRTAIVVDDGIATGASIRAALRALRRKNPKRLVLAVPVAPAETVKALEREADEVICLESPEPFIAIGLHYSDFR